MIHCVSGNESQTGENNAQQPEVISMMCNTNAVVAQFYYQILLHNLVTVTM